MSDLYLAPDGDERCKWCGSAPEFLDYHDREWGFPVDDNVRLFEKLCLESFQSGLSWRTILAKRENFRVAFAQFDFKQIAQFDQNDVERLLNDKGIVRHRGKIEAVINNAKMAQKVIAEFGSLAALFWQYETILDKTELQNISTSEQSIRLSKALKKQGWKFVGPTTVYAFMQAAGIVNDHAEGCVIRQKALEARKLFQSPAI